MNEYRSATQNSTDWRLPGLWIGALLLGIFAIAASIGLARAAPMPPRWVVDRQAQQCAQIVPGDECGDVVLPAGWEYLDGDACPAGFSEVELRPEWVHFKAQHCCTQGHSGSRGDCEDVIVQTLTRRCAFVDDISACRRLPFGWVASRQECPVEFTWVEDMTCALVEDAGQTGGRPAGSEAGPPAAVAQPETTSTPKDSRLPGGVCAGIILPVLGLIFLICVRRW